MTDLAELKRLAEAATQGTWFVAPNGSAYYGSEPAIFSTENGPRGPKICSAAWGFATKGGKADYYFIAAANPSAILSLIQRVETAEAMLKQWDEDQSGMMWVAYLNGAADLKNWKTRALKAESDAAFLNELTATPIAILQERSHAEGRIAGIEEAAKVIDETPDTHVSFQHLKRIAQAIRALKDQPTG